MTEREINKIIRQSWLSDGLKIVLQFCERYPNLSVDVLKYKSSGDTILHCASREGKLELVTYLLQHFAVNCRNRNNKTPLHEACQFGQIAIAEALLQAGADVNALKKADWTPLMLACTKIRSEEDGNRRKLLIELLINHSANVNFQNKDGWSCLHLSIREGDIRIVQTLINSGLNIALCTKNRNSALHIAALHGHNSIFKLFASLDKKSMYRINNQGNLPLHEAVLSRHLETFKLAVRYYNKEELKILNNSGFNVLHLSAFIGSLDILIYCIEVLQMDLDVLTSHKQNCLHLAACYKFWDVYRYCLDKGLNEYSMDKYGRLPCDYNKFIAN